MYLSMRQWTRKKPPNLAREIYNFVLHWIYKIPNSSTYDKWCSCHRTPPWCDFHAPILSPLHSASMVGGQCCVRNPWHDPTMWHPLAPKYKRVRKWVQVCVSVQCEPIPWHEALMGHPLMSKCTPAWSSPPPQLLIGQQLCGMDWDSLMLSSTLVSSNAHLYRIQPGLDG